MRQVDSLCLPLTRIAATVGDGSLCPPSITHSRSMFAFKPAPREGGSLLSPHKVDPIDFSLAHTIRDGLSQAR